MIMKTLQFCELRREVINERERERKKRRNGEESFCDHQGTGSITEKQCNASLVAQRLKRLPSMRETWVTSPGLGRSPGEGNGNPLQYSCLENPMDGGAWRATVHGVAQSRTRLKRLSSSNSMTAFTLLHWS